MKEKPPTHMNLKCGTFVRLLYGKELALCRMKESANAMKIATEAVRLLSVVEYDHMEYSLFKDAVIAMESAADNWNSAAKAWVAYKQRVEIDPWNK